MKRPKYSDDNDMRSREEDRSGEEEGEGQEGDETQSVHHHGGVLPLPGHVVLVLCLLDLLRNGDNLVLDVLKLFLHQTGRRLNESGFNILNSMKVTYFSAATSWLVLLCLALLTWIRVSKDRSRR